jgi:hypothetical protein
LHSPNAPTLPAVLHHVLSLIACLPWEEGHRHISLEIRPRSGSQVRCFQSSLAHFRVSWCRILYCNNVHNGAFNRWASLIGKEEEIEWKKV